MCGFVEIFLQEEWSMSNAMTRFETSLWQSNLAMGHTEVQLDQPGKAPPAAEQQRGKPPGDLLSKDVHTAIGHVCSRGRVS